MRKGRGRLIKVYFVNGFLDAGKTSFIKELLKQNSFQIPGKTMLLLCEEGEEEYDEEILVSNNVTVVNIENEEDFNPEHIMSIEKEIRPKRVIVEFNGMWNRKNIEFPWYWDDIVEVVLIDGRTFEVYSKNMKSIVSEQVRNAAMAIFNRCDNVGTKLAGFRRSVKAVNSYINIVFKDKDGEMNPRFDEDLPYDIHGDKIELTDDTFGIFYLDAMEDVKRYLGKEVSLVGMVMKKSKEQLNTCIIGRFAMTCCAEDLSLFGFICDYESGQQVELDEWVNITAIVDKDYAEKFDIWYPVLNVVSLKRCDKPKKEVIEIL